MHITSPEKKAIESGQAITVSVDQLECVVIRKDVFERIRQLSYDDSEWTDAEKQALASFAADAADEASPIE